MSRNNSSRLVATFLLCASLVFACALALPGNGKEGMRMDPDGVSLTGMDGVPTIFAEGDRMAVVTVRKEGLRMDPDGHA